MHQQANPGQRPRLLVAANILALSILPLLALVRRVATPASGGDGLGGALEVVAGYLLCIVTCWVLVFLGRRRKERPRWLAQVAILLSLAPMVVLALLGGIV